MSLELDLVRRLATSPFTRGLFWEGRPRLALHAGHAWVIRDRGVFLPDDAPVDATLHTTGDDLDRMLRGEVPTGEVRYVLGTRSVADRRKQAFALLALAALGWCGPWPDPEADPGHIPLLRRAWWDLGIGPEDGRGPLFPPGGPLDVTVRITETVEATWLVTDGLSDRVGWPEVVTAVPPRSDPRRAWPRLRAAALWLLEEGRVPASINVGESTFAVAPDPRFAELVLPHHAARVLRVG